jgi:hypothetical protein
LPVYLDRQAISVEEIDRVGRALAVVTVAGAIPRRLGQDADSKELALDKKRAKRVAHVLKQSFSFWSSKTDKLPLADETIKIAGAQLIWESFELAHRSELELRIRTISTWAVRTEDVSWGRTAVMSLENELRFLAYALRD